MGFPEGGEKKKIKLLVNSIFHFSFNSYNKMSTVNVPRAKKGFKKSEYRQPL